MARKRERCRLGWPDRRGKKKNNEEEGKEERKKEIPRAHLQKKERGGRQSALVGRQPGGGTVSEYPGGGVG